MTINKFQGKTESEAIDAAKRAMGPNVVIMNVRTVKPRGFFGAFRSITYEVTAALEEPEDRGYQPVTEKKPEAINLAADENLKIQIPSTQERVNEQAERMVREIASSAFEKHDQEEQSESKDAASQTSAALEERLDNLQSLLENRISEETRLGGADLSDRQNQEGFSIVKMLYQTLLDNEVNEKYANQILDELEKVSSKGNDINYILSHIYQKLILKFGQPKPIEFSGERPKVVFFIGPTGVGKTTTIAKIASKYKVDESRKVAFLTADTYRIAATEQLRTYANILDTSLTIVYSPDEVKDAVEKLSDFDLILVDTAGFSHKNNEQCEDVRKLVESVEHGHDCEVFLVLSSTTKYSDLKDMCDIYKKIADYKLIFTKLDETSCYGNLLNIHLYSGASLSYTTYGQNVPDDIEVFNTQKVVKKLLGGD